MTEIFAPVKVFFILYARVPLLFEKQGLPLTEARSQITDREKLNLRKPPYHNNLGEKGVRKIYGKMVW